MHQHVNASISPSGRLSDALRYAIATEGKRIRPLLCYASADLCGMPHDMADLPAVAIELVHIYSLVHDDLPAMDNDDLRRGQPTVHKVYDDATAILVGDALQSLAFEVLTSQDVPPEVAVRWVRELSRAAGAVGMVQGQSTDLEGETCSLTLAQLETMHLQKTGAMIDASLQMPLALHPDDGRSALLRRFGQHIGLAFQIRDDILDVEGSTEDLGKPAGSDEENDKSTFVSLLGLNAAHQRMGDELAQAQGVLDELGEGVEGLRWIADYIVARRY